MRAAILLLLVALLAACADAKVKDCTTLAGPGWSVESHPPAVAPQLLARLNLPEDSSLIWLSKGKDRYMVCDYSSGLIVPGCSDSKAYEFAQKDGRWVSRGTLLPHCDDNPNYQ